MDNYGCKIARKNRQRSKSISFLLSIRSAIILSIVIHAPFSPLSHDEKKLFANTNGIQVIRAEYVRNVNGLRHPYYNIHELEQNLPIKVNFLAHEKGGIVFFHRPGKTYKLYFLLNEGKFKFNHKIRTSSWPPLQNRNQIYFPHHILHPILSSFYNSTIAWNQRKDLGIRIVSAAQRKNPKKEPDFNNSSRDKGKEQAAGKEKFEKSDKNSQTKNQKNTKQKYVKQSLTKIGISRLNTLIIDPGHGGKDPGAIVKIKRKGKKRVIYEKDIVLKFSKSLVQVLKKRFPQKKIYITRKKDRFIHLDKRTQIANKISQKLGSSLFVSLHVNSSISSRTKGLEIFYLAPNSSNEKLRFELMGDKIGNKLPEHYLLNATIIRQSKKLAKFIADSIRRNNGINVKIRGVKQADFVVLRGVLMPAVLIELGFITNPKDRKNLQSSTYKKRLMHAIAQGIESFISNYEEKNLPVEEIAEGIH